MSDVNEGLKAELVRPQEERRELLSIFNNFMCNASAAYLRKDWELLKISYDTAQWEREQVGLPKFIGGPNIDDERQRPTSLVV